MDQVPIEELLEEVRAGRRSVDDAMRSLRRLPFQDLGFARVDHHRPIRQGLPEAVYAPGKTPHQCAAIVRELLDASTDPVVLTRADPDQTDAAIAATIDLAEATITRVAALATVTWRPAATREGRILVITAGTADLPVADECVCVLQALGFMPERLNDCGVAGIHRLLQSFDQLAEAEAIVVVAGMEGALASVVGGLTSAPVVAVPTSVGYGSSFQGMTATLAMLASCASGITVVGIDNGFGAACAVARLLG
ncbi:MAG: nickel pincer cofactor biosynthesis protein LarB [Acidimicrobiales bacterium]